MLCQYPVSRVVRFVSSAVWVVIFAVGVLCSASAHANLFSVFVVDKGPYRNEGLIIREYEGSRLHAYRPHLQQVALKLTHNPTPCGIRSVYGKDYLVRHILFRPGTTCRNTTLNPKVVHNIEAYSSQLP